MKKLALILIIGLSILSCKKDQFLPEPTVDFHLGYLAENERGIHVEDYLNQDFILRVDLDTALALTVLEDDLEILGLDPQILYNLEFTVYVNTSRDNEIFVRNKNVYSIGGGGGCNNVNQLSSIFNSFILPLRMTGSSVVNDNKIELDPQNDYIRISYESNYSNLSKVKTILIKN
jgi:hypothetical protein